MHACRSDQNSMLNWKRTISSKIKADFWYISTWWVPLWYINAQMYYDVSYKSLIYHGFGTRPTLQKNCNSIRTSCSYWCIISILGQYVCSNLSLFEKCSFAQKGMCNMHLPLLHTLHFWLNIYQIDLAMNPIDTLSLPKLKLSICVSISNDQTKYIYTTLGCKFVVKWYRRLPQFDQCSCRGGRGEEGLQLGPVHTQSWISAVNDNLFIFMLTPQWFCARSLWSIVNR